MPIQHALQLTYVSCIQMMKFNGKNPYIYNATLCMKPFKVIKQVSPLLLSNDSVFSFVMCLALFESADCCPIILKASRRNCGSPAADLCWLHMELMCSCQQSFAYLQVKDTPYFCSLCLLSLSSH